MRTIEVSVQACIRPTERGERVVSAIENIFPEMVMDIRDDRVEAYGGLASLKTFHELLRRQQILDTARCVMQQGRVGNAIRFQLNKQAAFMGMVSFPPQEEPLGSIHVLMEGDERLIDWLAPETVEGEPLIEISWEEMDPMEVQ